MNQKKIRKDIKILTDELGALKEDKFLIEEQIEAVSFNLKLLYSKCSHSEICGDDYKSVYESFDQKSTDWKRLAMVYKPSKVRISKYTKKIPVERIKIFEL